MDLESAFLQEMEVVLSYLESEYQMSMFLERWIPFVYMDAELRTLFCIKYAGCMYVNFYRLLSYALRLKSEQRMFARAGIQLELYYRDVMQLPAPGVNVLVVDKCAILELSDKISKTVCLRVSFLNKID